MREETPLLHVLFAIVFDDLLWRVESFFSVLVEMQKRNITNIAWKNGQKGGLVWYPTSGFMGLR